jgi:hypothetical protein
MHHSCGLCACIHTTRIKVMHNIFRKTKQSGDHASPQEGFGLATCRGSSRERRRLSHSTCELACRCDVLASAQAAMRGANSPWDATLFEPRRVGLSTTSA